MGVSIWEGQKAERLAKAAESIAIALAKDISIADYEQIRQIVQSGRAREYFQIGDQIVMNWNDGTNTYEMPWDVVDFGAVVDPDGNTHQNAMWLESHYGLPGLQFDGNEAFYVPSAEMDIGTYHFTIGNNWGTHCVKDKVYQFTTTAKVPAGGQLVLGTASSDVSGLPDTNPSNWRVRVYSNGNQASPTEILTLTEGSGGTDLGSLASDKKYSTSGINNMQRSAYGYNRWGHSAMRQWLNSELPAEQWWTPKNPFDHRPDYLASKRGFMAGLPSDFLAIVKPIRVTTALNTVSDVDIGTTENTADRFFLASLQQEFIAPQLADVEGTRWEYWYERLNHTQHAQGGTRTEHIRYAIENHTSAQPVRLRSANRGGACSTWYVSSSGLASSNYATAAHRPAPACVIY